MSVSKKYFVNLDLQGNEIVDLKADTLDITSNAASANTKRVVYWSGVYYYSDGTNWIPMNGSGGGGSVNDVTATAPLSSTGGTTPDISITQANTTTDGYLSSTDWDTFNNKQDALGYTAENTANKVISFGLTPTDTNYPSEKLVKDSLDAKQDDITLTTTGTSGAATLIGNTLNIPQYAGNPISVSEEGTVITSAVSSINFTGAGATATAVGNAVTVDITGGGGGVVSATNNLFAYYNFI